MLNNNRLCALMFIFFAVISKVISAEVIERNIEVKLVQKKDGNLKPYEKSGRLYLYKKYSSGAKRTYAIPRNGIVSILIKGNAKDTWMVEKEASFAFPHYGMVEVRIDDKKKQIFLYLKKVKPSCIKGMVVDFAGKPYANLKIALWENGENTVFAKMRTNKQGRFSFKVIHKVDYKLRINSKYVAKIVEENVSDQDVGKKVFLIKAKRSVLSALIKINHKDNKTPFSLEYTKKIHPDFLFRYLQVYRYSNEFIHLSSSRYYKKIKSLINGNQAFLYGLKKGNYQVTGVGVEYGKVNKLGVKTNTKFYPVKGETLFAIGFEQEQTLKINVIVDEPTAFLLSGNITDSNGTAMDNVMVKLTPHVNFRQVFSRTTDINGNFKINLNEGRYKVDCTKKGYLAYRHAIKLFNDSSVSIKLNKPPMITGHVLDSEGQYIENARALFIRKGLDGKSCRTNKDGAFSIFKRDYKILFVTAKGFPAFIGNSNNTDFDKEIKITLQKGKIIEFEITGLPEVRGECILIITEKDKGLHPVLGSRGLVFKNDKTNIPLLDGDYEVVVAFMDEFYKLSDISISDKTNNFRLEFSKENNLRNLGLLPKKRKPEKSLSMKGLRQKYRKIRKKTKK